MRLGDSCNSVHLKTITHTEDRSLNDGDRKRRFTCMHNSSASLFACMLATSVSKPDFAFPYFPLWFSNIPISQVFFSTVRWMMVKRFQTQGEVKLHSCPVTFISIQLATEKYLSFSHLCLYLHLPYLEFYELLILFYLFQFLEDKKWQINGQKINIVVKYYFTRVIMKIVNFNEPLHVCRNYNIFLLFKKL